MMLGSCRNLVMIPQPGPQTTYCWCSIHQHTLLVCLLCQGLGRVPAAKFTVDHASMN